MRGPPGRGGGLDAGRPLDVGLGGVPMALLVLCDELGWRLRATSFLLASKVVCACVDYDVAWRPQLILGQQLQGKLGVPASEFSHFVFGEEFLLLYVPPI